MKNRIFLTFYWIFDICVSLAPIALCYCFRHSVQIFVILLNYIFCTSIYLANPLRIALFEFIFIASMTP